MKKEHKILALSLISICIMIIFVNIVSAVDFSRILEKVKLTDLTGQIPEERIAQILIGLLVTLIAFGLGDYLPFLGEKSWVNGAVAIIVGILAAMFIKKEELYVAIMSYSTLGMVLTTIIPFMIIFAISKRTYEKNKDMLFSKILWAAFIVGLILKVVITGANITGANTTGADTTRADIGFFGVLFYAITIGVSLLMLWKEDTLFRFLYKHKIGKEAKKIEEIKLTNLLADLAAAERRITDLASAGTSDEKKLQELVNQYNQIVLQINDMLPPTTEKYPQRKVKKKGGLFYPAYE